MVGRQPALSPAAQALLDFGRERRISTWTASPVLRPPPHGFDGTYTHPFMQFGMMASAAQQQPLPWPTNSGAGSGPPAAAPPLQPNPLLTLSDADARSQIRVWMEANITSRQASLRLALRDNAVQPAAWERAVKDNVQRTYFIDFRDQLDWIKEWAAPGGVWDKQKLPASELLAGKCKLKGQRFTTLCRLFDLGAAANVDGNVMSVKVALDNLQTILQG
ncbi:hypothetical protein LTR85_001234 [Meristemomyces frigidus]|nr:hypothetical protein LTR85_001234 [Meristemomyces frigidus]